MGELLVNFGSKKSRPDPRGSSTNPYPTIDGKGRTLGWYLACDPYPNPNNDIGAKWGQICAKFRPKKSTSGLGGQLLTIILDPFIP